MNPIVMTGADWLAYTGHFLLLSLLSVGGTISTAPDMHRYLVNEHHWLTDPQFTASIAIAQAAPGPNILFVALVGWNVGVNAAGLVGGCLALLAALLAILIPSSALAWYAGSWSHRNRERREVRAFKQGMTPLVLALLLSTGLMLATGGSFDSSHWRLWLVTVVTSVIVWRTNIHLLWLLGAGALLGALGLV